MPQTGRQRPDLDQVAASIIGGTDGLLLVMKDIFQKTPFPNLLSDHDPDCDLTPSASVQTCTEGLSGCKEKERTHRSIAANDVGVKSWLGVGYIRVCRGRERGREVQGGVFKKGSRIFVVSE